MPSLPLKTEDGLGHDELSNDAYLIERDFASESPEKDAQDIASPPPIQPVPIVVEGWSLQQPNMKKRLLVPFTLPSEPRPEQPFYSEKNNGSESGALEGTVPTNTPYSIMISEMGGWMRNSLSSDPSKPKKGSVEMLLEPAQDATARHHSHDHVLTLKDLKERRKSVFLKADTGHANPAELRSKSVASALSAFTSAISTCRLEPPYTRATLYHRRNRGIQDEQTITLLASAVRPMYDWDNVDDLLTSEETDHPWLDNAPGRKCYQWRGLGPSGTVFELVEKEYPLSPDLASLSKAQRAQIKEWRQNCAECRMALFIYTSELSQQIDPASGRRRLIRFNEVGELYITRRGVRHLVIHVDGTDEIRQVEEVVQTKEAAVEQIIASLTVVVEMARRWRYLR